jgi:hypothetical protein
MKLIKVDKILINTEKIIFIQEEKDFINFYIDNDYKLKIRVKNFNIDKLLNFMAINGENSDVVDLSPIVIEYKIIDLRYGS